MMSIQHCFIVTITALSTVATMFAQVPSSNYLQGQPSGSIRAGLKKLSTVGSVLYIAAHPDDENTRLITYLAKQKGYRVGYLSLTRGDGGQNLIGSELEEQLGAIRTYELLAARAVDGGEQYFTRAYDFGFSKTPEETFKHWDRKQILEDVVRAIRAFRPDIIITRFSPKPMPTHGHHTASAQLALEAFSVSGEKEYQPQGSDRADTWRPRRIFWNTSSWFYRDNKEFDTNTVLRVDVGEYNSLLGASCTEIAALSRSMHRSQGFGSALTRGSTIEYLQQLGGDSATSDMFDGVQTGWERLRGGTEIAQDITTIINNFRDENPAQSVPALLALRARINAMPDNEWKAVKLREVRDLIIQCLGLHIECISNKSSLTRNESLSLTCEAIVRQPFPVRLEKIVVPELSAVKAVEQTLMPNKSWTGEFYGKIDSAALFDIPFWMRNGIVNDMFVVQEPEMRNKPDQYNAPSALFHLTIDTASFILGVPIQYKKVAPEFGEIRQPVTIQPQLIGSISNSTTYFTTNKPVTISLQVEAKNYTGKVSIRPDSLSKYTIQPQQADVDFSTGSVQKVEWQITPLAEATEQLRFNIVVDGKQEELQGTKTIQYEHIPPITITKPLQHTLIRMNVVVKGNKVAYITGAGDDIPAVLRRIGYSVDEFSEVLLPFSPKKYDAIIVGIRALNIRKWKEQEWEHLFAFAKAGGTVIMQYNTTGGLLNTTFAPFNIKLSRERVTEEQAQMTFLQPKHPIMTTPNVLTEADFQGWVQERGLYFPSEWDTTAFVPLFSCHDEGEKPQQGSLLVAQYGKGTFIYTGLSFFRQLPNNVTGAIRLFTNMIAGGKKRK